MWGYLGGGEGAAEWELFSQPGEERGEKGASRLDGQKAGIARCNIELSDVPPERTVTVLPPGLAPLIDRIPVQCWDE